MNPNNPDATHALAMLRHDERRKQRCPDPHLSPSKGSNTMMNEPGWSRLLKRKDGLTIRQDVLGTYEVLTYDARPDITSCPCCDKPLKTIRSAQLVANALYPLTQEQKS